MFSAVRNAWVKFFETRYWSFIGGSQSVSGEGVVPVVFFRFIHFTDCALDHFFLLKLSDD